MKALYKKLDDWLKDHWTVAAILFLALNIPFWYIVVWFHVWAILKIIKLIS